MINSLFEKFAKCVATPYYYRMIIQTTDTTEDFERKYYMVDFNTLGGDNIYFMGDNGSMVFISSNDNEDGRMFDTYEKGWEAVKELAMKDNVIGIYVEDY